MNKQTFIKQLIPLGLLITFLPRLAMHFVHVPDPVYGFFVGAGLAMMLVSLYKQRRKC